mmetsp:Transcript_65550/g.122252  ORF Transcript_65550/g.122252 Transcript_65550/m.122252 type:complete len:209 (-) Transcript_65550:32-658(-)
MSSADATDLQSLRAEVKDAEQESDRLRAALARTKEQSAQTLAKLQTALDDARENLKQNMSGSGGKAEMARLEEEIRAADAQTTDDALTEQLYLEQLKELRLRSQEHRDRAISANGEPPSGRCAVLSQELKQAQQEIQDVEAQLSVVVTAKFAAHAAQQRAQAEGDARIAKLRGKIEELWRAIEAEALRQKSATDRERPRPPNLATSGL